MTPRTPTLSDRVVLVTRPRAEAGPLAAELRARGATAVLAPAIRIEHPPGPELEAAMEELARGGFAWLVLTSRTGVDAVASLLGGAGGDWPPVGTSVAAVGEGTAGALRDRGVEPDLVPSTFTTAALARAMPAGTGKVLLARADIAPDGLEDTVAAKGWEPVRVDAYRTRLSDRLPPHAERTLRDGPLHAVTFTSASTVAGFVRMIESVARDDLAGLRAAKVVCIGPVTAEAAGKAGLPVDAVAHPHTIGGLIAALEHVLGAAEPGER